MSFIDGFENCALGRSTDILANWPLSDPGITRMIAPGKDGGKALSLVAETSGGGPIRRGRLARAHAGTRRTRTA